MTLAVVFPGQGSQSVGMLLDIAAEHPSVRDLFVRASDAIGLDLWQIVSEGPVESLNRTEVTQPALLTASVAVWELLAAAGVRATAMAGHSLGEYSALVASGAIDFEDAVRVVRRRGELMQGAVTVGEGAMAAVLGLDEAEIASACASVDGVVTPANFNAVGQIVIAGSANAVALAAEACKTLGAKRVVMLDVSVPSHCPLMRSVEPELAAVLQGVSLRLPSIPVFHNVDAKVSTSTGELTTRLVAQLANPVRWVDCVQALASQGVNKVIECGPGNVLTGLIKRIDRNLEGVAAGTVSGLQSALGHV
ncbi:MAG: ACP S-malonyltransferase [Gammaproteobacteria bacterium]|nr:ACP S-malonyltransferase [Gammaproteobacteria bacterium]